MTARPFPAARYATSPPGDTRDWSDIAPVKLAFAVVYVARGGSLTVVQRHLEYIRRYAPACEWWIEAVAHRADPALRDMLADVPVHVHGPDDIPSFPQRGSVEHAHYLDALVAAALRRGATHVCTLDEDSFPVRADWLEQSLAHLAAGHALVAPLRAENRDTDLPHPSFLLTTADFIRETSPRFLPTNEQEPGLLAYRRKMGQRADTGIGYSYAAHRLGRSWAKLLRSNAVNDHRLIGGIYGDIVFHFAGGGRPRAFLPGLGIRVNSMPPEELAQLIERVTQENSVAARVALARLQRDMDGYLAYLRGQSPPP